MQKQIIKTLPHLILPLMQMQGISVAAQNYSLQIARYLDGIFLLNSKTRFYDLKQLLNKASWERANKVLAKQQFSLRGDIIDLWPPAYKNPIRIEFFGDQIEHIYSYDLQTGRKDHNLAEVLFNPLVVLEPSDAESFLLNTNAVINVSASTNLPINESNNASLRLNINSNLEDIKVAVFTAYELTAAQTNLIPQEWEYYSLDYTFAQLFWNNTELLASEIASLKSQGFEVQIFTKHFADISEKLNISDTHLHPIWEFINSDIPAGFISNKEKLALFTDREIFGSIYLSQRQEQDSNVEKLLAQLEGEISVGDYVVHEDHGIALYAGLTQEEVGGSTLEYIELQYAGTDKVLVPLNQVNKLTRYIGPDGFAPELRKLSRSAWEKTEKQAKQAVTILAREMVEHYARRNLANAVAIDISDTTEYENFCKKFPYDLTNDQNKSLNEILLDLSQTKPMNRLLIGDVGFGKTEVMIRAAFKMVEAGFQVAILCPTTVLASQHYGLFKNRFSETKYKIESLSRFQTDKANKNTAELVSLGEVDIVIGTHRLLSKDVKFSRLGLLVIDEEQRFGVKQKEKIKQINYGVHELSVSATPIPRTLSMSLASIQDISIISEAPKGRKPVETKLVENSWNDIVNAIIFERDRGGQVYFLHNQVKSIQSIKAKLENIIPGLRVIVAHGQMSPSSLDRAMMEFYQHKADLLLCTTIIENGLDVPNVNTMIVHQAERFGLAQLYQLRGRVGRSDKQAYCYLLTSLADKEISEQLAQDKEKELKKPTLSRERLQAIVDSAHLGAGFQVASRDLELRGAGDLLGEKQSGQISKIGYALYMQLLAQEIGKLKSQADLLARQPEYVSI